MRTKSRTVAVLVFDELELLDVASVAAVLSTAGRHWNWRPFKLFAASAGQLSLATRNQLSIAAHGTLADCPTPELLIVPGGYGARRLLDRPDVLAWLARAAAAAELVASVGYGALPLAKAGSVGNARVALPADVLDLARELAPAAEFVTTEAWLASGKLVSARTSVAALELALEIVARLLGPKHAAMVGERLGHVVPTTHIHGVGLGLGKKPPL